MAFYALTHIDRPTILKLPALASLWRGLSCIAGTPYLEKATVASS
jgi:hypothetical protein